jgi:hypothetical protein
MRRCYQSAPLVPIGPWSYGRTLRMLLTLPRKRPERPYDLRHLIRPDSPTQPGGTHDSFGARYVSRLERIGLHTDVVRTNGSLDNLQRLLRREVHVAFVQGGTYSLVPDPEARVRGLAAVYLEPLWVFHEEPRPCARSPSWPAAASRSAGGGVLRDIVRRSGRRPPARADRHHAAQLRP